MLKGERRFTFRDRHDAQRHLENHTERAKRTGQQPRQIKTGHILDHTPAKLQALVAPIEHSYAQQEITNAAAKSTTRAVEPAGNHAADGGAGTEMRRLEAEHLALPGKQRLDLGQATAGTQRYHQFRRIVIDHTAVSRHYDCQPVYGFTVKPLAIATDDFDRTAAGRNRGYLGGEFSFDIDIGNRAHQKRSSSGCGSLP